MSKITINADRTGPTINKHIYGHFAEHLGRCIYDGIWVGEESSIPNVRGIRSDIVEALKGIKIPNLRWPGGCFADTYHWKDGIGPREKRPSIVNVHWGGVTEDNSFGTHEFLDLCGQLECAPYICGNVGSGTVQEMSEWIEYVNSDAQSPMTDLRGQNGRPDSWSVPFWGVGNENWGCGGWMRPEYYADLYRRFACYCKDHGKNKLFRIACGPNDTNYHWTETLMENMTQAGTGGTRNPSGFMQGLALHYYTFCPGDNKSATDFGEDEWYGMLRGALKMDELVTRHCSIMDRYDPEKLVALVVDEWGSWYDVEPGTNPRFLYQQNSLRDALVASTTFDIFHKHSQRIRMTNIAQTVNVLQSMILTDGEKMILTPTYHVFEMNAVHHDAQLVDTAVDSGVSGAGLNEVPTLSASASRKDNGPLYLTVSNLDANNSTSVAIDVRGCRARSVAGRVLTAPAINSCNTFDEPGTVEPKAVPGLGVEENLIQVTLPPRSVTVLEIPVE